MDSAYAFVDCKNLPNTTKMYPMRETDREKFVRLAQKRVSNALKMIQLVGNLANRSNYDYTDEDVAKILRALQEGVGACRKRFELAAKAREGTQFTLE